MRASKVAILTAISMFGCGGGGGGEGSHEDFSGKYSFLISSQETDCVFAAESAFTVTILQNGSNVVLQDNSRTFQGSQTEPDAILVTTDSVDTCRDEAGNSDPRSTAHSTGTISIHNFDGESGDLDYFLDNGDCSGDNVDSSCSYALHGTAVRLE